MRRRGEEGPVTVVPLNGLVTEDEPRTCEREQGQGGEADPLKSLHVTHFRQRLGRRGGDMLRNTRTILIADLDELHAEIIR